MGQTKIVFFRPFETAGRLKQVELLETFQGAIMESMAPRDARLQAAALRLAAERLERGEPLAPALESALAEDMSRHAEELEAVKAHEGPLPKWMAEELDRRDSEDAGTEEDSA